MVVARVILIDGAVLTNETAASEDVDLHWLFVLCTHFEVCMEAPPSLSVLFSSSPFKFKFIEGDCIVPRKYSHH